jgi:hypothetical protein
MLARMALKAVLALYARWVSKLKTTRRVLAWSYTTIPFSPLMRCTFVMMLVISFVILL